MDDLTTTPVLDTRHVSFSKDGDIRSPRTPTWSPPTPSSPFDYRRFLSTPTPEPREQGPSSDTVTPPPDAPLPWVWQCHLCRNRYPLGVTRRCLYDGHYYCSGQASQPNVKRRKKSQACSSEFDYEGWEEYGEWRTRTLKQLDNPRVPRACETCVFPSQCRTPAAMQPQKEKKVSATLFPAVDSTQNTADTKTNTAVDEAMADTIMTDSSAIDPTSRIDFDTILKDLMRDEEELLRQDESKTKPPKETKGDGERGRKRSGSKERNFSKKFNVEAEENAVAVQSGIEPAATYDRLQDLVMPVFDILSGKNKAGRGAKSSSASS